MIEEQYIKEKVKERYDLTGNSDCCCMPGECCGDDDGNNHSSSIKSAVFSVVHRLRC